MVDAVCGSRPVESFGEVVLGAVRVTTSTVLFYWTFGSPLFLFFLIMNGTARLQRTVGSCRLQIALHAATSCHAVAWKMQSGVKERKVGNKKKKVVNEKLL